MKKFKMLVVACIAVAVFSIMAGCNATVLVNRYLDVNRQTLAFKLTSDGTFTMSNYSDVTEDWINYEFRQASDTVIAREWEDRINDIKKVVIKNNVGSIGSYAFYAASNLTEVYIGADVTNIGTNAFKNCFKLNKITIDPANTSFKIEDGYLIQLSDNRIIRGVDKTEIVFGSNVAKIEDSAFAGLTAIKKIDMSQSSVTEIPATAFINCSSLTEVVLPAGLVSINDSAFAKCSSLKTIDLSGCAAFTTIDDNAFFACTSLNEMNLPASLKKIGVLAFSKSSLSKISFAKSDIKISIGSNAFYECNNLKEVYIANSTMPETFKNNSSAGYLVTIKYAASQGEVVRDMSVYIATEIFDIDVLGAYMTDAGNFMRLSDTATIDGIEYVVYQAQ